MLQTILTAVAAICGPLLGYLGGVHATRAKRVDDERDNDREDSADMAAQWQAMLDNQRRDFEALLAPMRTQIDDLGRKVGHLEAALDRIRGLYRTALDHIRALRTVWPAGVPIPRLPADLEDEL